MIHTPQYPDKPMVVLLAGGRGTRLADATAVKPKPMVDIGDRPILWHIMRWYAHHDFLNFTICLGYMGDVIKDYFVNYRWRAQNIYVDLASTTGPIGLRGLEERWKIWMYDTGLGTNTGGRLRRIKKRLCREDDPGETIMMTYGDGLADVDITALLNFHREHGRLVTMTSAIPPGRFGSIKADADGRVRSFDEKSAGSDGLVNAGYFVIERPALDMIYGDATSFEYDVLPKLAQDGQLMTYVHRGWWKPMDTPRDRDELRAIWDAGNAPWRPQ